jgi:hypothetical protein
MNPRLSASVALTAASLSLAGLASCQQKYTIVGGNSAGDPGGWTDLFNGRDLAGLKPFLPDASADPAKTWFVEDRVINCTGTPAGYIATADTYTNYELELDWRFLPEKGPGNSGVLLRVQGTDEVWPKSFEAQLQDRRAGDIWLIGGFPAKVAPERTSGRHTTRMGQCSEKPVGEWNSYRIVVDGTRVELYVNGQLQNVATDVAELPGRIALQSEGAWIQFRNVRIRPLLGKGTGRGYE